MMVPGGDMVVMVTFTLACGSLRLTPCPHPQISNRFKWKLIGMENKIIDYSFTCRLPFYIIIMLYRSRSNLYSRCQILYNTCSLQYLDHS